MRKASTHGGEYHSPCPGCGGKDRFHVWPEQNDGNGSYWCRACGKAGDSIQFLMDFEGLSFPAACQRLDLAIENRPSHRHLGLPKKSIKAAYTPRIEHITAEEPAAWIQKAGALADWAHQKLLSDTYRLRQLSGRGIKRQSVCRFRLGWNPEDLFRSRESWGLCPEMKHHRPKKLWLPAGLIIPFYQNSILRIRIRRPKGEPRYYVLTGSSMQAMTIGGNQRALIVVESELDAILIFQETRTRLPVGTIALGSSAAKPDANAAKLLKDATCVLISLDFDDAGTGALKWWMAQYPHATIFPVPQGKDPGEAYQAGVNLCDWVYSGLPRGWFLRPSLSPRRKEQGARNLNEL